MRDKDHCELDFVPEGEQLILHAHTGECIERGEGLVHQQHVRLHRHATRDGDALLHAAGQSVRIAIGKFGEIDFLDEAERLFAGSASLDISRL